MSFLWHLAVSAEVLTALVLILRARPSFLQTTLITAWNWGIATAICWSLTWFADHCTNQMSPALADHAWYLCSILALTPPVAVLGSRRPGTRVWSWFILFPMLLVLSWPLVALRLQGSEFRGLSLETPPLIAFAIVLVMGVGNYCGTRNTLSAILYGAATLIVALSCSTQSFGTYGDRSMLRLYATAAMGIAIGLCWMSSGPVAMSKFDRLWLDFFNMFGVVWGRRIQDRVNFIAQKEQWPVRLELDGFFETRELTVLENSSAPDQSVEPVRFAVDDSGGTDRTAIQARIEHSLRWLLRRFVDEPWIDSRLGPDAHEHIRTLSVDS